MKNKGLEVPRWPLSFTSHSYVLTSFRSDHLWSVLTIGMHTDWPTLCCGTVLTGEMHDDLTNLMVCVDWWRRSSFYRVQVVPARYTSTIRAYGGATTEWLTTKGDNWCWSLRLRTATEKCGLWNGRVAVSPRTSCRLQVLLNWIHYSFSSKWPVSKATLGKPLRHGADRIWAFPSA